MNVARPDRTVRALAALLLLVGVVVFPLRAAAATIPMPIAYDAAVRPTARMAVGRLDAVRREAEHGSINAYDPGRHSYDNPSNPHAGDGAGAVHTYDDAPESPDRRQVQDGVHGYDAALEHADRRELRGDFTDRREVGEGVICGAAEATPAVERVPFEAGGGSSSFAAR